MKKQGKRSTEAGAKTIHKAVYMAPKVSLDSLTHMINIKITSTLVKPFRKELL